VTFAKKKIDGQPLHLKKNRHFQVNVASFLSKYAQQSSKLCEGMDVKGGGIFRRLPWALAAMVLAAGCSGVLMEKKDSSGTVERVKIDGVESWDTYDNRPRLPYANSGKHGLDDMSIMLKSEKTF
jgi:hypothetical protein